MGGSTNYAKIGNRFAYATDSGGYRHWMAANDVDVSGLIDPGDHFIIATAVWNQSTKATEDSPLKLRWNADGGSFTDVLANKVGGVPFCFAFPVTSLVHDANLIDANRGCTELASGRDYAGGVEKEAYDYADPAVDPNFCADGYVDLEHWAEIQWGINDDNASTGVVYGFELMDTDVNIALGQFNATITYESGDITLVCGVHFNPVSFANTPAGANIKFAPGSVGVGTSMAGSGQKFGPGHIAFSVYPVTPDPEQIIVGGGDVVLNCPDDIDVVSCQVVGVMGGSKFGPGYLSLTASPYSGGAKFNPGAVSAALSASGFDQKFGPDAVITQLEAVPGPFMFHVRAENVEIDVNALVGGMKFGPLANAVGAVVLPGGMKFGPGYIVIPIEAVTGTVTVPTEEYKVLYSEIRNLVRWMSKDVEGLKITDNLLGHYIIDGQRFITRRLKLPEFYQEMSETYTADATSIELSATTGWFFAVEIDDDGNRTPVPILQADDKTRQANQGSSYYCYLVGRNLYVRTSGEPPSAELSLKLFGIPILGQPASFTWTAADGIGVTANTIPDHFRELLIQYLMWKLRIATATKEEHFLLGRTWRQEFFASMAMYQAERSGLGKPDTLYTSFGKDVLT